MDEVFTPLVYCLAGELLAYYLAESRGAAFFCADRPGVSSSGRDRLRESQTIRRVDALQRLPESYNSSS
jgi:hypothetical protein